MSEANEQSTSDKPREDRLKTQRNVSAEAEGGKEKKKKKKRYFKTTVLEGESSAERIAVL